MEVVFEEDVGAGGAGEEVGGGVCGVGAAHAAEVAVGAEDGAGVGKVECGHELCPGEGVEEAAAE